MQLRDDSLLLSASDLTSFVACPRLTWLQREVTLSRRAGPADGNRGGALAARKGLEHERRHLESLRARGLRVVEIATRHGAEGTSLSAAETLAAMRDGADVVYQAVFEDGGWLGHIDFLRKLERVGSDLGPWSYEAVDTKLARRVKPSFVVQLALYSELLGRAQGREPEHIEVVLGTGASERLRLREFDAYVRRLRERFLEHLASATESYPEPVEHCAICDWGQECEAIRLADDHLSQVAGMRRDQVVKLRAHGVPTMAGLAAAVDRPTGLPIGDEAYVRLRAQAALQAREKADASPRYELLEPQEERGFALLPEPSPHDVFFDMEGDPYYEADGLEYLFGAECAEASEWTFRAFWGRDRRQEREAFERFIDWVFARWRRHPDLHVYHYAHYEPTALKRLAGQHGTREEEVDELLRHGVLVDLYAVVRQGLRISRPSYSIKELEAFYRGASRQTAVGEGGESIEVFEEWLETGEQALLDAIEEYNADDCRSTRELRDWLLDRRAEAWEQYGAGCPYVAPDPRVVSGQQQEIDDEARELMAALLDGVPRERADRDAEQQGRWLLAQLLDYHRREQRVVWWRFFALCLMDHEQLLEDLEAISGLEPIGAPEVVTSQGATAQWFSYPPQDFKFGPGEVTDPARKEGAGEVLEIDAGARRLLLKRTRKLHDAPLPRAIFPFTLYRDHEHRRTLRDLARAVLAHGLDAPGPLRAARRLVLGGAARVRGGVAGQPLSLGDLSDAALQDIVRRLDESHLFIQGPPGSGKTYGGARVIVDLLARGDRVGVTSNSHRAICKLLGEVDEAAHRAGVEVRAVKKCSTREDEYRSPLQPDAFTNTKQNATATDPQRNLVAGTSWLFVREEWREQPLDYLFVDEAGQVALADAAATAGAARNVVLLGDPQQLAQVSQAAHPDGAGDSVLRHLLGKRRTVAPAEGVFLERSYRMHPDVCAFVSDLAYDGRLRPAAGTALRRIDSDGFCGTGLRFVAVEHEGNRQSSPEESRRIAEEIDRLLRDGWVTDEQGQRRRLGPRDVLVVAAYNHQVSCLREHIPHDDVAIGTVDKFQGQQAPVVFYSLGTSTPAEAPRGVEFLFSTNRLNVAVSRAQCLAVLVGNPALLDAECRTVEQMRLVNGACRFAEAAERE
jgi:uncharacterized protein